MLQNQHSILEEVAAKIVPPFPTVLSLFSVSINVAPVLNVVVQPTFVCPKRSVYAEDAHSVLLKVQICFQKTTVCFGGKDISR